MLSPSSRAGELFLHLAVPSGLGVETAIAKGGFHIRSRLGLQLHSVDAGKMAPLMLEVGVSPVVHNLISCLRV